MPQIYISFGKHANRPIKEVPADYLEWMVDNRTRQWQDAEHELNRRSMSDTPPPEGFTISGKVIDEASLTIPASVWKGFGLHTWLCDITTQALEESSLTEDNFVHHKGHLFEFIHTATQFELVSFTPAQDLYHA